jgi:DNA-binding CsgD family transcriptional regulator
LCAEKNSQDIADALFISVYTVNTHRKNILHKLGIKNTAGLVKFASDNGLV